MTLKLYNTLTRKKNLFEPLVKGEVGMYSCGPTVYDFAHIGNFRSYMAADILKRYLKFSGYKVKHIMNITDVDDKTIKASTEQKLSLKEYTEKYANEFFEDLKSLNIDSADTFPRATEHIPEMTSMIQKLLENGLAYKGEDNSIYFAVSKFKDYGRLAKLKKDELKIGARVKQDDYEKEEAQDFALWKAYDKEDGDVFWETELGKGRPGWHIECSAMNTKYLGESFDIHSGGVDLIFPHHENEIAQAEGATGKPYVKYWVHNEHLIVDGKKMSKSKGNFYTLRDILKKGYDSRAVRYLLLSTHYKTQLNFTFEGLDAAKKAIEKFNEFIFNLHHAKCEEDVGHIEDLTKEAKVAFEEKMDDDLNISEALAVIFDFMRDVNKLRLSKKDGENIIRLMKDFDKVLGVIEFKQKKDISGSIKKLIDEREEARKKKDFKTADKIRDDLKKKSIELMDTPEGVVWKKID
ncbi:MAG: cysteine--tRNA ligase [Nanoarchaeota archaeon]|nr:cysteine--tRNA ligase [Nanoarchaeota archaeon]